MTLVMMDIPSGPSRADAVMKKGILALITKAEAADGRSDPQVEDIKPMRDGKEVWILKSDQDGIAYIVSFKPSPQGGSDIELSGPKKYQRRMDNKRVQTTAITPPPLATAQAPLSDHQH